MFSRVQLTVLFLMVFFVQCYFPFKYADLPFLFAPFVPWEQKHRERAVVPSFPPFFFPEAKPKPTRTRSCHRWRFHPPRVFPSKTSAFWGANSVMERFIHTTCHTTNVFRNPGDPTTDFGCIPNHGQTNGILTTFPSIGFFFQQYLLAPRWVWCLISMFFGVQMTPNLTWFLTPARMY